MLNEVMDQLLPDELLGREEDVLLSHDVKDLLALGGLAELELSGRNGDHGYEGTPYTICILHTFTSL